MGDAGFCPIDFLASAELLDESVKPLEAVVSIDLRAGDASMTEPIRLSNRWIVGDEEG